MWSLININEHVKANVIIIENIILKSQGYLKQIYLVKKV